MFEFRNSTMIKTRYPLLLGSKSPRRQQLLRDMGLDFSVVEIETDESVPASVRPEEAAVYLAEKKAASCIARYSHEILLTADTTVILDREILGKPSGQEEAGIILKKLSGRDHEVVTGICIAFNGRLHTASDTTRVFFRDLSDKEIGHYINNYKPFDKAGAYGIQEWIGMIGIRRIEGSYFNVVGLPVMSMYRILRDHDLLKL